MENSLEGGILTMRALIRMLDAKGIKARAADGDTHGVTSTDKYEHVIEVLYKIKAEWENLPPLAVSKSNGDVIISWPSQV